VGGSPTSASPLLLHTEQPHDRASVRAECEQCNQQDDWHSAAEALGLVHGADSHRRAPTRNSTVSSAYAPDGASMRQGISDEPHRILTHPCTYTAQHCVRNHTRQSPREARAEDLRAWRCCQRPPVVHKAVLGEEAEPGEMPRVVAYPVAVFLLLRRGLIQPLLLAAAVRLMESARQAPTLLSISASHYRLLENQAEGMVATPAARHTNRSQQAVIPGKTADSSFGHAHEHAQFCGRSGLSLEGSG
jgi:hypothetical protein